MGERNGSCSGHIFQVCVVGALREENPVNVGVLLIAYDPKLCIRGTSAMGIEKTEGNEVAKLMVRHIDPDWFGLAEISKTDDGGLYSRMTPEDR